MKISAIQFHPKYHAMEYNLGRIKKILEPVTSEVIVLPELFNTGYVFKDREELYYYTEELSSSKTIEVLKSIALEKDCGIVAGIAERDGDKMYNSAVFITKKGVRGVYRKLQLFMNEKDLFDDGDLPLSIIEYKGVKYGLMVCFDWAFPEIARTLANNGAEVICHPANLVLTYCQTVMRARSIENRVYTVTANRIGTEGTGDKQSTFTGHSQITDVYGELIAKAGEEETVITADIDPKKAQNKYITPKNHLFNDRRSEFYLK